VPIHVQVLSGPPEISAATAQEISLSLMSLSGDPALENRMPKSLELRVPDASPKAVSDFSDALSIPVVEGSGLAVSPRLQARPNLLPAAVSRARSQRKTKSRAAVILTGALIAYLVLAAWLWIRARNTSERIDSMERQIAIVEPDVERIQQLEQRWKRLEPSFEKSWFPLVQLSHFTSALPGSGVVVREFRSSGRNIRVVGQARDVQLANRLLEDLQEMEAFSAYQWNMPNPKVEQNNTATFVISGEPKNEGSDS
jgi:Tfp pilus assembly protein PilN